MNDERFKLAVAKEAWSSYPHRENSDLSLGRYITGFKLGADFGRSFGLNENTEEIKHLKEIIRQLQKEIGRLGGNEPRTT